jgi:ecdysteroid 25-hydroxylase CYP302A1
VVKEKVFGGLSIVWLFHPDDIKTLFENEGKYPSRRSHLALKKYRKEKPEFYNNGGLLPTNGPEWARMRKAAQKPLTKQLLSNHIQVIIWDIEFAPS